ncbi:predicted protein [Postia placenta Mad-698-R]|nr:predicted protein [Postia placenta Mad-698-R]
MTNDERTNNDWGRTKSTNYDGEKREARSDDSDDSDERKANVYIHTKEPRQDDVTTMLEGRTMTYKSIRTSKPVWLIETHLNRVNHCPNPDGSPVLGTSKLDPALQIEFATGNVPADEAREP